MIDPETQTPARARAWNLCDDLGQIEYIFSDKTGTLTCNVMELRKCSINGVVYGNSFISQAALGSAKRAGGSIDVDYEVNRTRDEGIMRENMASLFDMKYVESAPLSFIDTSLHEHIAEGSYRVDAMLGADEYTNQATSCIQFFTLLAVCHSVLIEATESGDVISKKYTAQSPDEAALVAAARDNGFTFVDRQREYLHVDVLGVTKRFQVLNVLEFNSDRKRMSVVVRVDGDEEHVVLFCKGADSVVFERLEEGCENLRSVTSEHLEGFARDGLRTLSLAYRIIGREEYEAWSREYEEARACIGEGRDEKVEEVVGRIERDLKLMGATAIEDRLQDGVPESIAVLAKAGIKIWVLTGDKLETAINIGFASNLLDNDMTLIVVRDLKSEEETQRQLIDALRMFWRDDGTGVKAGGYALVIDGESLGHALGESCRELLLEIGCRCRSVVCCRVSPLQKALVVALVRKGLVCEIALTFRAPCVLRLVMEPMMSV
jgi:phospholipid-translocating ATPase